MRAASFLFLIAIGCGKPEPTQPEPEKPDRPAPARESEKEAIPIGLLWKAYQDDAAAADRKYGQGVLVKFGVDKVEKTATGFTVTRTIEPEGMGVSTHKFLFPKSAASRLEGVKDKILTARGKVIDTSSRGLLIRCE